jgi:hypothetical protein
MPFDGADHGPKATLGGRLSSGRAEEAWYDHWQGLFERRAPHARLRKAAPEGDTTPVLRLLGEARCLIEARERWTRGVYETPRGTYCAVGALHAASRHLRDAAAEHAAHKLLLAVVGQRGFPNVEAMNDRSTHEQVLAAFDEAIMAARREVLAAA